jgi:hypothetical protein
MFPADGFHLLTRNIFFETGYRFFYMDRSDDGFSYDVGEYGLFSGIGVNFNAASRLKLSPRQRLSSATAFDSIEPQPRRCFPLDSTPPDFRAVGFPRLDRQRCHQCAAPRGFWPT